MAGGGTRQDEVHGVSDRHAAYAASDPGSPADIGATICRLLEVDPRMTVPDRLGRPVSIALCGELIRCVVP
jgi:hypothetical protein